MKILWDIKGGVPGVREAGKSDEGDIFALLLMMHAEMGWFSLNPRKVLEGIQWATERKGGIIYVIEEDRRIVATLGMCIMTDWYSDDEYLLERWNFVHPNYRRGRDYGRRLIEQAKWVHEWFKSQGMVLPFQCGINSLDRTEAKVRLYARHMACIGAYFMYGHPPRLEEKVDAAMAEIEEAHRRANRTRSKEVVSTVETVIRCSRESEPITGGVT